MATVGAKTDHFENLILEHLFRNGCALDRPLYIGLITGNPTFSDLNAVTLKNHEVAAGVGYSRQLLSTANMAAAVTGVMSSAGTEINFGTSVSSDWGTVTGFTISTATGMETNATHTGEIYYYGVFDTEKSVAVGDSVRITAGNLTIEEQ